MKTYIYRSSRKRDVYIYLAEEDDFSKVPKEIYDSLGIITFTMELDIKKDMKLARENPAIVIKNLNKHGFHMQLPNDASVESVMLKIARNKLT